MNKRIKQWNRQTLFDLTLKTSGGREMSNERIRLSDREVADILLLCKFVIEGTGANHECNNMARLLMKRFIQHCESSSERGARVSELLEYDTSRTKLDSLMT